MSKEAVKELASDKEIIDALATDLVQLAQQCNFVMQYASYPKPAFKDAELLDKMCKEILETFIKKEEINEESENLSNEEN